MKLSRVFALSIMVLLIAAGAAQLRADSGDDLAVCCNVASAPALRGCTGVLPGCVPIDSTPAAINRCNGVVMGCAESSFLCVPSATAGKQDCTCAAVAAFLCPLAN